MVQTRLVFASGSNAFAAVRLTGQTSERRTTRLGSPPLLHGAAGRDGECFRRSTPYTKIFKVCPVKPDRDYARRTRTSGDSYGTRPSNKRSEIKGKGREPDEA